MKFLLAAQQNVNPVDPFAKFQSFLTDSVLTGILKVVTPLAAISIIVCSIGMYLTTEEHARDRWKRYMIFSGVITAVCFMAQGIVAWIQSSFK